MNEALDPLEPLLSSTAGARPDFRDELRVRTARCLRRRHQLRWLPGVAAGVACLLLGLAVVWWLQTRLPTEVRVEVVTPGPPQPPEAPPPDEATAVALEWRAFDSSPPQRSERYLDAGNHYVEQVQDYASALRCYEEALTSGGAQVREINADDNWLVMALKMDQQRREK